MLVEGMLHRILLLESLVNYLDSNLLLKFCGTHRLTSFYRCDRYDKFVSMFIRMYTANI